MVKQSYRTLINFIERTRFQLLLISTILLLLTPAFSNNRKFDEFIFLVSLSFLFIQSMILANYQNKKKRLIRIFVVILLALSWLKPFELGIAYSDDFVTILTILFFIFITSHLIRFISRSAIVNVNVIMASVNIYLLMGIIGAILTKLIYQSNHLAYNFPNYIEKPDMVHYLYYSFVTLSTVGYGDITPRIPITQTLAYFISVIGQLYVAIIIASLIGKYLMHADSKKENEQ